MATRKIEHTAAKKQTLTLDEVAAWVQDAMRSGASGNSPVEARVNFSGKLIKLGIEAGDTAVEDIDA